MLLPLKPKFELLKEPGRRDDAAEVASNAAVVADAAAGLAPEVSAERAERRVELLENDSLRLNIANLAR